MRVHLFLDPGDEPLAHLRGLLDDGIDVTAGREPDPASFADCEVLVGGRAKTEQVAAAPNARVWIIPWAGIPGSTLDVLAEFPGVALHNLHHNAAATAETAVALLLAAAKALIPMDRDLRRNDWGRRYESSPSVVLEGGTALVLGYGAIGRRVACACVGLGMHVHAVRRSAAPVDEGVEGHATGELRDLLPHADAVIVTLPLTDETRGLIGPDELELLPATAVLVNVGRGPVVDETALYEALRDGRLHAAGLDAWYTYPREEADRTDTPPSAHPFHELDNVVMSPHRAGSSLDNEFRRMAALAPLLNAAARGDPIPNPVDRTAGY